MRILIVLMVAMFANAAHAQQCPQCTAADACIKDYTRAIAKIKSDYKKGVANQRKGREQSLRDRFSSRSAVTDQDSFEQATRLEIEKLKDCLSRSR